MGRVVICCFRPRPGREEELRGILREHLPALRKTGLVTDRPSIVMQAADGTYLEVFEWRSRQAVEEAHRTPAVRALWDRIDAACESLPLAALAEAQETFPNFDAVTP